MKKTISIILLGCFVLLSKAQKNEVNLVFGMGPNFFIQRNQITHYLGDTWLAGINVLFNKKNHFFKFNPGISITSNFYLVGINEYEWVGVTQRSTTLNLDVLMKISKKNYFRFGLALSRMEHNSILVSIQKNNSTYYGFSNNDVYEGYSCTSFQAAVIAGLSFPFKLFKKEMKFDISIFQNASALVNNDYYYYNVYTGGKVKVLGVKSLPTKILFALEINLLKKKKTKKEIEEGDE